MHQQRGSGSASRLSSRLTARVAWAPPWRLIICTPAETTRACCAHPNHLQANCPNCGEPNLNSYFGDILTVAGPRDKNTVKCPCCSSTLEFDAEKRAVSGGGAVLGAITGVRVEEKAFFTCAHPGWLSPKPAAHDCRC